jgi:hypothetical protein
MWAPCAACLVCAPSHEVRTIIVHLIANTMNALDERVLLPHGKLGPASWQRLSFFRRTPQAIRRRFVLAPTPPLLIPDS